VSSFVKTAFYRFLHDLGVPSDELGAFITRNPWIFKDDLDDLQVRVNYLQSKKFSAEMVARVVRRNPRWLSFRYSIDV
jgi:mTERF domain-containing protein